MCCDDEKHLVFVDEKVEKKEFIFYCRYAIATCIKFLEIPLKALDPTEVFSIQWIPIETTLKILPPRRCKLIMEAIEFTDIFANVGNP